MDKDDNLLVSLREMYRGRDWFYDAGYDQYGRPVLYIKYECHETLYDTPDRFGGKQLLTHFAASLTASKEQFFSKPQEPAWKTMVLTNPVIESIDMMEDTEEQDQELELSVRALTDELDRLEKICGSNILQEIFYETHDKDNAVTNMSAKYPEVRRRMEALYDRYSFDIIYEELDG